MMQVDTTNTIAMGNQEAEQQREHLMEKLMLHGLQDASVGVDPALECDSGSQPKLNNKNNKETNERQRQTSSSSASSSSSCSMSEIASTTAISTSDMQASFAERTACEMEQIVNWYKTYEGDERLKKENQQSRSMPDNAFIFDDEEQEQEQEQKEKEESGTVDEAHGSTIEQIPVDALANEPHDVVEHDIQNIDPELEPPQHEKIVIHDDESVLVQDFYTPSQSSRKSITKTIQSTKRKTPRSLFSKAVRSVARSISARSISKASVTRSVVSRADENDEHNELECQLRDLPPRAIKIVIPDDDESSVISSLTTPVFEKRKLPHNLPFFDGKFDSVLLRRSETEDEIDVESRGIQDQDDDESTVSPDRYHEPQDPILTETAENYDDEEKEVLEMLSSTNIECCASIWHQNDCGTSHIGTIAEHPSDEDDAEAPDFTDHCESTEQQVHEQIEATEDLIRNTENMAEIIAQLQQSAMPSIHDIEEIDSGEDHHNDLVFTSDNQNFGLDEYECDDDDAPIQESIASIETPSLSSEMLALWELEGNVSAFAAGNVSRTDASRDGIIGHKPNQNLLGLHPRNYGSPVASPSSRSSLSNFAGWVWRK